MKLLPDFESQIVACGGLVGESVLEEKLEEIQKHVNSVLDSVTRIPVVQIVQNFSRPLSLNAHRGRGGDVSLLQDIYRGVSLKISLSKGCASIR